MHIHVLIRTLSYGILRSARIEPIKSEIRLFSSKPFINFSFVILCHHATFCVFNCSDCGGGPSMVSHLQIKYLNILLLHQFNAISNNQEVKCVLKILKYGFTKYKFTSVICLSFFLHLFLN